MERNTLFLPSALACRIIEREMQITESQQITKESIIELLQDYTKAVEFYEERNNPRFEQYKRKMKNLLQRKAIAAIMDGKEGERAIKKQLKEEAVKRASTHSKRDAIELIQNSDHEALQQREIITSQLQTQQKILSARIQRKRAVSARVPNS